MTRRQRILRSQSSVSRRAFLAGSAGAVGAASFGASIAAAAAPTAIRGHAAGSDILRVGLVGCGGRGTGAVVNALQADPGTELVAMGDVFADRIESSLQQLLQMKPETSPANPDGKEIPNEPSVASRIKVDPDHRFVGFDAYQKVIDNCDVVLLCSTPHFRPQHLKAAVAAGKHIFCEKPVATDAPGVRSVLATAEEARAKKLSLVCGFCWRYHEPDRAGFGRMQDGAIGTIESIHTRYLTGTLSLRPRKPHWSDMEDQLRNWYYYSWASGDHIVEQAIHSINKIAWALRDEMPIFATAVGGRQVRTGPEYGNVYDHFAVVYEYKNGARAFHDCRQTDGCYSDNTDFFTGTKGMCTINSWGPSLVIKGENPWHFEGDPGPDMYLHEHQFLFDSIRKRQPINDGIWMAHSTMMAILGRMAAYTGQKITWEQALNSKEDLSPKKYEWGPNPVPPVSMPGRTKFA
jgi:predicted dehydrogenase